MLQLFIFNSIDDFPSWGVYIYVFSFFRFCYFVGLVTVHVMMVIALMITVMSRIMIVNSATCAVIDIFSSDFFINDGDGYNEITVIIFIMVMLSLLLLLLLLRLPLLILLLLLIQL